MASAEELKAAYLYGRNNNNELHPDKLMSEKKWGSEKVSQIFNLLVEKRLCSLHKSKSKVWLRVREEEIAKLVRNLSVEEYKVYCCIEESGTTGIWTQDIQKAASLQSHVVLRAVRTLSEIKKLIKPLKSIHQKNKKIYILANLEPSKEVVGGTFYDNGEFDEELIKRLRDQISHLLKNSKQTTLKEISNYIKSAGFGKDLSDEDLKTVIKTLIYEQAVQTTINSATGEFTYMWARWNDESFFKSVPCGVCPVFSECVRGQGNVVSPTHCKYYTHWLAYDPT